MNLPSRRHDDEKSGFEPIPGYREPCRDPSHQFPSMLVIPPGKQYRHVCPSCKQVTVVRAPNVSLSSV